MHLAHPALTMGGKRKGKQKFRNAAEAQKARELAAQWEQNQIKWASMGTKTTKPKRETFTYKLSTPVGRETQKINSLDTGHYGAVNVKQTPQYTGTKILGIGTMHKSNAVPIFSDEEAQDIARMRRG
jgi:hypothetical protein